MMGSKEERPASFCARLENGPSGSRRQVDGILEKAMPVQLHLFLRAPNPGLDD